MGPTHFLASVVEDPLFVYARIALMLDQKKTDPIFKKISLLMANMSDDILLTTDVEVHLEIVLVS